MYGTTARLKSNLEGATMEVAGVVAVLSNVTV